MQPSPVPGESLGTFELHARCIFTEGFWVWLGAVRHPALTLAARPCHRHHSDSLYLSLSYCLSMVVLSRWS